MSAQSAEALHVLRRIWQEQEQSPEDLECAAGDGNACKKMVDAGVGYDDFAAEGEDPSAAWRARLAREGKLVDSGETIRDLVLGSSAPDRAERG